jgi:uncharacterized protein YebE (UPF0316 family)
MLNADLYTWVVFPLLIFGVRVLDVSLGTMRYIYISRGKKYLASLLGFIEVFIWIALVSQIVRNASNFIAYFAYAAGFAAGTFVGLLIEDRLALGTLVVRAIVQNQTGELVERLRTAGYGVTTFGGEGASGPVNLIYTIVKRRNLPKVTAIINQSHPQAFLSIEDVRSTQEGIFPTHTNARLALFGAISPNER